MGRAPLTLGSWGRIRIDSGPSARGGRPRYYRARARYRDFDGVTRQVEALGSTKSSAEGHLLQRLRERADVHHGGALTSADKFSLAANLWIEGITEMVDDGRRSPGTLETYRRHLDRHVLPALGQVRLGEVSTPLVDRVIRTIKAGVSPATAKACRSVVSGVLALAVRHGALATNPVRDVERIQVQSKRSPRALSEAERDRWFETLATNPKAVKADLPDLTLFMLSTGVRIGEVLGVLWNEVDLVAGEVAITYQVIRVKGQGLMRAPTKSSAGERVLTLPTVCVEMLRLRWAVGVRGHEPVFCDALGGFRDPANVRRDLRNARAPVGSRTREELGRSFATARRNAGLTQRTAADKLCLPRSRISLIEAGRVRVDRPQAVAILDAYKVAPAERREVLAQVDVAVAPVESDALSWITSHNFRKTTATILDDAGQSARQIADQLGHARPSMTQDVYMGRRAKNPLAAEAIDAALTTRRGPKRGA